ncbi:flagellar FlbD family protein [Quadrisphaera sp. DSM 44207]|uniref:flagellar FlbD family protein n=1 Tax=Quadrisphaera sp. DSM 44207 TaxID=1881057 RepID=UPI0008855C13|nr:flagellar FlbD family protein [Quadrisphaera sp. DSM 44207]SDQ19944.1 flagellar protein FlbD [Quadrisphaera sp. DSM 44207]
MIIVTRLNGPPFAVNPDLLERVESTPDTILTLIDGTKYVVTEPVEEVVRLVREFRAAVIATAHRLEVAPSAQAAGEVADAGDAEDAGRPSPDAERPHLAVAVPLRASRRS